MPLHPDFRWIKASQHDKGPPTVLALRGEWVARLMQKLDGSWYVRLDCQQPITEALVMRDCSSFEQGVHGAEAWAERHEERIREEMAVKLSGRRKDKV